MTRSAANASATGRAPSQSERECRSALDSASVDRRRQAALGLIALAEASLDDATVARLEDRALADRDSDVRQFAVEALGVAGTGTVSIRTVMQRDADEWVRAEAVVAYSRAGGSLEPLRTALEEDESGWVRRNALIALAKTDEIDQWLLIDRLKNDQHRAVREFAADYLGEHATDTAPAVRVLAAILARDPSAFVRAKAASSLGDLGSDRAIEAIEVQGLNDRSDDVQRSAKRALAHARGVAVGSIDSDPDRRCRPE